MNKHELRAALLILLLAAAPFFALADDVAQVGGTNYETLQAAVSAANEGQTVSIITAGTYTLPNIPVSITIQADVDGVAFNCEGSGNIASIPGGATFKNASFTFGNANYHGFQHAGTINMEGCTLNGKLFNYGTMNFSDCDFMQANADYHMWIYGGDANFTDCTFTNTAGGKFLHLYNESGATSYSVTVTGCKFINESGTASKAAINVKATCNNTALSYSLDVEDSEVEGAFPEPGVLTTGDCTDVISPLVQVDDRKEGVSENITVVMENVEVYTEGSEVEVVEIGSLAELKAFRDAVNAGTSYSDKIVRLTADLDVAGETWTPIGGLVSYPSISFKGTFDGNGHTISNLTVTDNTANYAVAALFGSIAEGSIVNLTLTNVNIQSTHYAAAIAAYTSNTPSIINCHVIGGTITSTPELVGSEYDNGDKVGGIMGYCTAGTVITECTVEGVTMSAYRDLGGICGYAGGSVSDCTVKDVTLIQDDTNGYKSGDMTATVGEVVGGRSANAATTNSGNGNTTENVIITQPVSGVAQIGETTYGSLAEAIAAVPSDGTQTTITMIGDETITGNVGVAIGAGQNVVLDLNGHTISQTGPIASASYLVRNNGALTIQDSTDTNADGTGTGKMTCTAEDPDTGDIPGYATNLISNYGVLNITSGYYETLTNAGYASFVVDNYGGGTANVSGGRLTNNAAYAYVVRMFCNSTTACNTLNISGTAVITGSYAVWMQYSNGNANKASLNISGGIISATSGYAVYAGSAGGTTRDATNVSVDISGGTIEGTGAWFGCDTEFESFSVSGGTFAGFGVGAAAGDGLVTGGTFTTFIAGGNRSDTSTLLADGYVAEYDEQTNTYTVVGPYVAQAGETYYGSLAEAIAAVPANGTQTTITMIGDETIDVATSPLTVAAGQSIVLELNGHQVVGACASGTTSALITNRGTLTIQDNTDTNLDGTGTGKLIAGADPTWTWDGSDNYSGSYASNLIRNEGTLVVESGLLSNVSTGSAAYAIDNYSAGSVTVNGGSLTAAKASAIRMFYNNGGFLTVNGGVIGSASSYMGVQVMGTGTNGVTVSLTGGTYYGQYSVYAGPSSSNWSNSSVAITGGTYNSYVCFTGTLTNVSVTDGTFYAWVGSYGDVKFISGGTFSEDIQDFCVDGFIAVKNGDGTYGVVEGETVSVTAVGFATFSSTKALDFTDVTTVYAYIATVDGGSVAYTRIWKVPAGTGLLLRNPKGAKAVEAPVPALASGEEAESTDGNAFVAVSEDIASLATAAADGATNYILNNGSKGIGFYRANGQKVGAGKAYLVVPASAGEIKAFYGFDEDDATGIAATSVAKTGEDAVYNMAGQRLNKMQRGINISGGRMILVR